MDVFIFNFFFIIFPIKLSKIQNINKEPQKKDTCPHRSLSHSRLSSAFFFFFFFITFHIQFSLFSFFSLFRLIVTLTLYVIILATKKTLIY
jgi:hypothetical protein